MNPYLRVIQPIRPSTFFFAKEILEGTWPEMEPVSSTRPLPHVKLLKEQPIEGELPHAIGGEGVLTTSDILTALATIGLFFDNELLAKVQAAKWLMVDNHFFRYGNYREAVITPPGATDAGVPRPKPREPIFKPQWWWEGASPLIWWKEETSVEEAVDMWIDIENKIVDEINAWEPPPPTSLEQATEPILMALGKVTESFLIPHPSSESVEWSYRGGIVYAIWTDPFPGRESPFPIFAVREEREAGSGLGVIHSPTKPTLYFSAKAAVVAALRVLWDYTGTTINASGFWPEDFDPQPIIDRLESEVQTLMEGLRA